MIFGMNRRGKDSKIISTEEPRFAEKKGKYIVFSLHVAPGLATHYKLELCQNFDFKCFLTLLLFRLYIHYQPTIVRQ